MILMYKIIHGFTGIEGSTSTFRDTFPTTSGHRYKVKCPVDLYTTTLELKSFSVELPTCGITI